MSSRTNIEQWRSQTWSLTSSVTRDGHLGTNTDRTKNVVFRRQMERPVCEVGRVGEDTRHTWCNHPRNGRPKTNQTGYFLGPSFTLPLSCHSSPTNKRKGCPSTVLPRQGDTDVQCREEYREVIPRKEGPRPSGSKRTGRSVSMLWVRNTNGKTVPWQGR